MVLGIAMVMLTGACSTKAEGDKGSAAADKVSEAQRWITAFGTEVYGAWLEANPTTICPAFGDLKPHAKGRSTIDPWGQPYRFLCDPSKPELGVRVTSDGADAKPDTDDDIVGTIRDKSKPATPTATAPPKALPAPIDVTAKQLFADYEENEISADTKYKGKTLRVSGRVEKIGKDILDEPYVELAGSSEWTGVHASFKNEGALGSLKKGQQLTVRCRGNGSSIGSPLLDDCAIE